MRKYLLLLFSIVGAFVACAGEVADLSRDGVDIRVAAEPETVDVARDFFVTVTVTAPKGLRPVLPDLRDRFTGFRVAEDFAEDPVAGADGRTTLVSRWRLVPEPVAERYRLAPFVLTCVAADSGSGVPTVFCTKPVYFASPAARDPVTGAMEVDPKKDWPRPSWKLAGFLALAAAGLALAVFAVWWLVRAIRERVRVHRMSPVERAYYELERLLGKDLPGRGLYKDFYVELTLVVRRYVARQHGVRAPNLTTEEFFEATRNAPSFPKDTLEFLIDFLRKADMVKFAGVAATRETADSATQSARDYVTKDDETVTRIRAAALKKR